MDGDSDEKIKDVFNSCKDRTDAFDIPIKFASSGNFEVFLDAVSYVLRRYFDDGVRVVELRFNPCKEFNGVWIDPAVTIERLHEISIKEERRAKKIYGEDHAVKFMFSFNQANYSDRKDCFVIFHSGY